MMAAWGVERAAKEGKDCYLIATAAGMPLYRSLGFQDIGRFDVYGIEHCSMIIRAAPKSTAIPPQ